MNTPKKPNQDRLDSKQETAAEQRQRYIDICENRLGYTPKTAADAADRALAAIKEGAKNPW